MARGHRSATPAPVPQRSRRSDGEATRDHLLEVAGQVFAASGYSAASAKVAAERARLNPALVNYYFGSKRGLYEAVLREATLRVSHEQEVLAAAGTTGDPRARFAAALSHMVETALANRPEQWHTRVLVHELVSPPPLTATAARHAVKPFVQPLLELVGEILGLPPEDPVTQRALSATTGVVLAYILLAPVMRSAITPAVGRDPRATGRVIVRCALAGLDAIRADVDAPRTRRARRPSPAGTSPAK
jgi:AcrR family transcriptional regulator